jgi:hexulose-6-phosphate isomerase
MNRRRFVQATTVAALGAAAPAQAPAGPKKAISIWAFPRNKPIRDAMKLAHEAGFAGLELAWAEEGEITMSSTPEQMKQLAADARTIGIQITSLATGALWQYPYSSDDPAVREKAKAITRKMLELAAGLGVDAILVVPGLVGRGTSPEMVMPYETVYRRSQEALRELAADAARHKVIIGVENVWNRFLLSPIEMRRYIEEINSPWVRAYLDIGNVLRYGYAQDWIRTLGSLFVRVHIKDFKIADNSFVGLLQGDLDWKAAMAAFREVKYTGWIIAEVSPNRQVPDNIIWDTSRAMDYIFRL